MATIIRPGLWLPLVTILLASCGSGDGGLTGEKRGQLDPSFVSLSLEPTKTIVFNWQDQPNATHYKILESLDDGQTFLQIGEDISQGEETYSQAVPLFARVGAQYRLDTCDETRCERQPLSQTLYRDDLNQAIGFFKSSESESKDTFGTDVSLSADGTVMAVGANSKSKAALSSGAVYIFKQIAGQWLETAIISPDALRETDYFGISVSLSNDGKVLAIGAKGDELASGGVFSGNQNFSEDLMTATESGAVYVFSENADNSWSQVAYIKADLPRAGDLFGEFVWLSGDASTLAVSKYWDDDPAVGINSGDAETGLFENSDANFGSVNLYVNKSGDWEKQAEIRPEEPINNAYFGSSVELNEVGDLMVVGAGINNDRGRAYLFARNENDQWNQTQFYRENIFGIKVALDETGSKLVTYERYQNGERKVHVFDAKDSWEIPVEASVPFEFSTPRWKSGSEVVMSGNGQCIAVGDSQDAGCQKGIDGTIDPSTSCVSTGSVMVFGYDDVNGWTSISQLKSVGDTTYNESFGRRLAVDDSCSVLAVGALQEDADFVGINGEPSADIAPNSGAVFLF